jgi:hypothetical protein
MIIFQKNIELVRNGIVSLQPFYWLIKTSFSKFPFGFEGGMGLLMNKSGT